MKVVFVTREGYNLAGGRIRGYGFARELASRGIETEVLSYAEDLGAKDGAYEGSMSLPEKIGYNVEAYRKLSQQKNAIIFLQRVNYHSLGPFLGHIIKKNSLVLDVDDWEIREDPRYLFGFYPTSKAEYFTRKVAKSADFCIAGSRYLKDYLLQFNSNVYYIPSCVDTERFCPNGRSTKREGVRFAWTGTLHRKDDIRNVMFMIDCFKDLQADSADIMLDIVGDGIYRRDVVRYISNCKTENKINFVGWIHPDSMPQYLEHIDIGLFPLIQDTRFNRSKSPTKLFEYMAMEKPTVSSSVGEAKVIIENEKDGSLAQGRKDFINKMEILVKDRKLREDMGKNARDKIVRNYSAKIAGDRLFSIFTERYG